MLYYKDLANIIFTRNQLVDCDELIIISGYVGPSPIMRLRNLPLKSTVIYGMYGSEGIQKSLHGAILNCSQTIPNVEILYSQVPVHSKSYLWLKKGTVVSALIGSANFSTNGLTTPFRETLADATIDTFEPLKDYFNIISQQSIPCSRAIAGVSSPQRQDGTTIVSNVCKMPLYIVENGIRLVPPKSGLNWGMASLTGSHVNINDAYIRIGGDLIEDYPDLFPQKQTTPSGDVGRKGHRHNDNVEIIWDDGTTMTALLEGSVRHDVNGREALFPKQISSTPSKAELGKYFRKRLGLNSGDRITYQDLINYGKTYVDVSLQAEGIYYFDFSV